ncbi:MAG: acyl-CoA dehydrogenase C-terminal domain-containing protein [Rhodospirillaceae bacterium]|nr:acyl-CoA dehydrogenase C-terminal domain-containing protein [Rhodospirillaceae bacterium]
MTTYTAPLRDMRFALHEVFAAEKTLTALPGLEEVTTDVMDAVLEECAKLCQDVLHPLNQSGDQEGCTFTNGVVITPKGFKDAYKQYAAGGWCGLTASPDHGGQGLPEALDYLVAEMVGSANLSFGLYPGLSQGTMLALAAHGTDEQKKVYLPKIVSGEWQGAMDLTEPHCGSDLGLLRTKAVPNGDGSYSISGTKIFISAGDSDLVDNVVHLVLARLPDAPEGSKGISLFLVPKIFVNADGSLGKPNAVSVGSIEHKMGIKGSATCVMNFDGAKGWLVGQPHKGLACMFTMMNKERMFVGAQGISQSELAYQNAVAYAKDRMQGRAADGAKRPDKPADPIIVHPDIRNRLLYARAVVEAQRALALYAHMQVDISHRHADAAVRERADDMAGLLTPIIKAGGSGFGSEITNLCLQVFGGHGYVKEWGMEQMVRDVRITEIYEGTNTIQALDLIGRKLGLGGGRLVKGFMAETEAVLARLKGRNDMAEFTAPFADARAKLVAVTQWIVEHSQQDPHLRGAVANDYLRQFTLTCMAWMWVLMAEKALEKKNGSDPFYDAKLQVGRFFMAKVLPQIAVHDALIRAGSAPAMTLPEAMF